MSIGGTMGAIGPFGGAGSGPISDLDEQLMRTTPGPTTCSKNRKAPCAYEQRFRSIPDQSTRSATLESGESLPIDDLPGGDYVRLATTGRYRYRRCQRVPLAAAGAGLMFVAAAMLNPLCLALAPVALVFLVGYSYTKRFTWLSHWILGFTDGIAAAGGWIADRRSSSRCCGTRPSPRARAVCALATRITLAAS